MKITAIVLCAGSGERYGTPVPKQYQKIRNKKIYQYPLEALEKSKHFSQIILVIADGHEKYLEEHDNIKIVVGGKTRQKSVYLALQAMENTDSVVICDGVRPFLTKQLLDEHIKKLEEGEIAVNTCIPCHDTINIKNGDAITEIPNRERYLRGQTPQSFAFSPLLHAHSTTKKCYTDDCALLLEFGEKVSYVSGSDYNIKITTPLDLLVAENLNL